MAKKKLTEVELSTSYDSVIAIDGGKVRQVSKETIEEPIRDVSKTVDNIRKDLTALQDLGLFVKNGVIYDRWEEK